MKKMLFVLCITIGVLMQVAVAFAIDAKADGDDVLVPVMVIKAIPGFDPAKAVYTASDTNGWFVRGPERVPAEVLEASKMAPTADGKYYKAAGMKGKRFQVVQLKDDKYTTESPSWAKLENFIPASWISEKKGIAILVDK